MAEAYAVKRPADILRELDCQSDEDREQVPLSIRRLGTEAVLNAWFTPRFKRRHDSARDPLLPIMTAIGPITIEGSNATAKLEIFSDRPIAKLVVYPNTDDIG